MTSGMISRSYCFQKQSYYHPGIRDTVVADRWFMVIAGGVFAAVGNTVVRSMLRRRCNVAGWFTFNAPYMIPANRARSSYHQPVGNTETVANAVAISV